MMQYKVGDIILGKVTSVKPYALFLSFDDGIQGLLHISEISDAYIKDIEKFGTKGDEMNVKVLSIDSNNFLRVSLKQVDIEHFYTNHQSSKRNNVDISDEDFKPLRDSLDGWINNTLEKLGDKK